VIAITGIQQKKPSTEKYGMKKTKWKTLVSFTKTITLSFLKIILLPTFLNFN
jgi:hypothetical protein